MRRNSVTKASSLSCELMHDRAREAGSELRRALIGLASGSIGLMLVVFVPTSEIKYTASQYIIIAVAVLFHTLTVMCGLLAWREDAQRNYYWALELDPHYADHEKENSRQRKKYQSLMNISDKVARYTFVLGVFLIAGFVLIRLNIAHLMGVVQP